MKISDFEVGISSDFDQKPPAWTNRRCLRCFPKEYVPKSLTSFKSKQKIYVGKVKDGDGVLKVKVRETSIKTC